MSEGKDTAEKQNQPESTHAEVEQSPKRYYYDDATGYEIYDPESEDDDAKSDESS